MLALVLVLAAATPLEAPIVGVAPPRVDDGDTDNDDDDDTATADGPAAPLDTPMWGPTDEDDTEGDDDKEEGRGATGSAPGSLAGAEARPEVRLPLRDAFRVVATAAAVPVVVGAGTAVVSLMLIATFFPWVGYGVFLIVPAIGFGAGVPGAAVGAELGVALFGDSRDHHLVGLGSTIGAAVGLVLAWSSFRAGALDFGNAVVVGAGALVLGSATGTGVVLVARHADLPALPLAASGALIGVGSAALGVGAAFSLLGPVSNDSLAGPDEAVAPAVMVLGAATLAAGFVVTPRDGLVQVGAFLRDPWGAAE